MKHCGVRLAVSDESGCDDDEEEAGKSLLLPLFVASIVSGGLDGYDDKKMEIEMCKSRSAGDKGCGRPGYVVSRSFLPLRIENC